MKMNKKIEFILILTKLKGFTNIKAGLTAIIQLYSGFTIYMYNEMKRTKFISII